MKILAIRGANLASLAHPFEVELDVAPLASAGLFAITGPTGAGKSTLLDALCLALFNRTPRLGRPGTVLVGRSDDIAERLGANDVRSVLRRGAASGWAEVDFRGVDDHRYRARWSVRRARDRATGKLQDPQITLTNLDSGERLGGTRTETLQHIEDRLGLPFAEFCRSALLAQGDFAAFLRADAHARADLLERVTGTEIYGQISMAAHRAAAAAESGLRARREAVRSMVVLDEGERAALAAEIDAVAGERSRMEAQLARAEARAAWRDQRHQLTAAVVAAEAAVTARETAWQDLASARAQLDGWNRARELAAPFQERARLRQVVVAAGEAEAAALRDGEVAAAAISTWREVHDLAVEAAAGLRASLVGLGAGDGEATRVAPKPGEAQRDRVARCQAVGKASVAWLAGHRAAGTLAVSWERCAKRLTEVAEAGHRAAQAQAADDKLAEQQQAHEQRHAAARQARRGIAERFEQAELAAVEAEQASRAAPVDPARERMRLAQRRGEQASVLVAISDRARELDRQRGLEVERRDRAAGLAEAGDGAAAMRRDELVAATAGLAEAEAAHDRLRAAAGLDHLRAALIDGDPCPLCGAVEHPWTVISAPVEGVIAELAARVAALREQHRALTAAIAELTAEVASARRDQQAATAEIDRVAGLVVDTQVRWRDALAALGELALVDDPCSAAAAERAAAAEAAARDEVAAAEVQLAAAEAAERAARAAQEVVLARRADLDAASHRERDLERELHRLTGERAMAQRSAGEATAALHVLAAELGEILGEDTDRGGWRERAVRDAAALAAELEGDVLAWRREASRGRGALAEIVAVASAAEASRLESDRRASAAEARASAAVEAKLRQQALLDEAERAMVAALARAGFREEEATLALALGSARAGELASTIELARRQLGDAAAVASERRHRLVAHGEAPPGETDLGDDDAALTELRQRVALLGERHGELGYRLRADDDAATRRRAAEVDLARESAELDATARLAELIGSHDGRAFRTFAQSLSLDALLVVANQHLEELAPRYQLERVPRFDLDLQVVDRDMGDDVRSIHSLSGGETFLVSLALALALSSLSSQNVRVGTLFIDEGFGSLDPAVLDVALAVLDRLQATGRQVGIISHVPGLAERVGASIEIRPVGGGRSTVEVRDAG